MTDDLIAVEEKLEKEPKTEVIIPQLPSSVVTDRLEARWVMLRFNLLRFRLIWKYFGHPFKIPQAIRKLEALRRSFLGDFRLKKIVKVDGKYYHAMNGPGMFSNSYPQYLMSELDRLFTGRRKKELRTLLFAITKKCGYQCEHCFEWDNLASRDVLDVDEISFILNRFQDRGVGQVQFGGGEPMSRYNDLLTLVERHSDRSDMVIVTSGFQLTEEKAQALKEAGLTSITISLDHHTAQGHDKFRGFEGAFEWVIRAAENSRKAGLLTNLSLCATREYTSRENLMAYAELARKLGIAFIWLLEPHATGRYSGKDVSLSREQIDLLSEFYENLNFNDDYRDYPSAAYPAYHQRKVGCLGGGNRFLYIDTNGHIKACPMCGSTQGYAGEVDIDEATERMQATGCGPFHFSEI